MGFLLLSLISFSFSVDVIENGKPVPQTIVEAYFFEGGQAAGKREAKTNTAGRSTFQLKKDEMQGVIFRVLHKDVSYFSDPLSLMEMPPSPLRLLVYPTSTDLKPLKVKELRTFLDFNEETHQLRIDQEILIENKSHLTIVPPPSAENTSEVFRFSIPENSFDLRLSEGFSEQETRFEGSEMVVSRPMTPGLTRFSWSALIERKSSSLLLQQKWSLPLQKLNLVSNSETLKMDGLPLSRGPTKYFEGKLLPVWGLDFNGQQEIKLSVSGFPIQWPLRQMAPPLILALLLIVAIFRRKKSSPLTEQSDGTGKLFEDLRLLEKLKEAQLVSDSEYSKRRLEVLERLVPQFEAETK